MSQDAREYAAEKGASIMIYPPSYSAEGFNNVFALGSMFPHVNEMKIAGFQEIFGKQRWPSNG